MARVKQFFIYFVLVVAFFVFSQVMIYFYINTTYQYKNTEIKTSIPMQAEVQATSINGFAKGKIKNQTESEIENKYIKIECYSKHNILMGTKYSKIDKIGINEEKEFEIRFNYNKVDRAVIDIIEEEVLNEQNISQEEKTSDAERNFLGMITAVILLYFM